ncbi:hypothetical protein LXL04_038660 [Taraxacum kok-saghyz]
MSTTGFKFSRGDVSDRFKSTALSNIENQHPAKSCSLRWVYVISRRNCRYFRLLFNGAIILAAALFCSNFGDVWLVFRWERRKVLLHKEKQERQTIYDKAIKVWADDGYNDDRHCVQNLGETNRYKDDCGTKSDTILKKGGSEINRCYLAKMLMTNMKEVFSQKSSNNVNMLVQVRTIIKFENGGTNLDRYKSHTAALRRQKIDLRQTGISGLDSFLRSPPPIIVLI